MTGDGDQTAEESGRCALCHIRARAQLARALSDVEQINYYVRYDLEPSEPRTSEQRDLMREGRAELIITIFHYYYYHCCYC